MCLCVVDYKGGFMSEGGGGNKNIVINNHMLILFI